MFWDRYLIAGEKILSRRRVESFPIFNPAADSRSLLVIQSNRLTGALLSTADSAVGRQLELLTRPL